MKYEEFAMITHSIDYKVETLHERIKYHQDRGYEIISISTSDVLRSHIVHMGIPEKQENADNVLKLS